MAVSPSIFVADFKKVWIYRRVFKNLPGKSKSGQNYYGKLQVDETSEEKKSMQKLIVFI